jgi:tetratricopeptide (TPR) repeat protein
MAERDTDLTDAPLHTAMDQFTAHIDRGWDLIHRGDLRGAQVSAEKSLELDPQAPEAHNLLGYVKAAQGQADEALELYRQAIALDDTFVEAMLNAAEVLIHPLHDFDAAINLIDEAMDFAENADETADALLLKYDAYVHQGDKDGARRVVSNFPDGPFESPRLNFLVGRAHFESGDQAKAQALLLQAIASEPGYGDAHYTLGLVHEALGESKAMVSAFLRTREADLALAPAAWAPDRSTFEDMVRAALARLPKPLLERIESAELLVAELPGAEVVADGVDPRTCVLLETNERFDAARPRDTLSVRRVFMYQRNTERAVDDLAALNDEIELVLEEELCATFPELAQYASERAQDEDEDEDEDDESDEHEGH